MQQFATICRSFSLRQALLSVVQSSCSHTWDAFQLAHASFRLYCVRNSNILPADSQKLSGEPGPHLLGDAPKINISPLDKLVGEEEEEESSCDTLPAIKIYNDNVDIRFLVCGLPCTLDACLLGSLEDGLNALLNIEIRGSKLHNRVSIFQEMHQLKNDVQKMSGSLEMIQQILQTMTTLHPSTVASSSTPKHLGSLERNPVAVPLLFPQSAPWNWLSTWWIAPLSWMRPSINAQHTPMTPSPVQQEGSISEHHTSVGSRDGQNIGSGDVHLDTP